MRQNFFQRKSKSPMMNRRSQRQMQLINCSNHGQNSELFIVEGESASSSVSALCQTDFQAVLPLQGKPLNAYKATAHKVDASPLHVQFAQALGIAKPTAITTAEMAQLNFGNIYLLFDPDADGIHIGALVILYIQKWLPQLFEQQKVHMLRAPMYGVSYLQNGKTFTHYAYLPEQLNQIKQNIETKGYKITKTQRFQSIGSVPPKVLEQFCINPSTRQANIIDDQHVQSVVMMFG